MANHSVSLINNAKTEMANYSQTLVAKIEDTGKIAIAQATAITEKMKQAATTLNTDVKSLKTASDQMLLTLTNEIETIKNQFIDFGQLIKGAAMRIGEKTLVVRNEFTEAINQVDVPMRMVKEYGRRCKEDNVIFLPTNIFGMIYWGFLKGVV